MARPEITGKKYASATDDTDDRDRDAYSVDEFCRRHGGISRQLFYKLRCGRPDAADVPARRTSADFT